MAIISSKKQPPEPNGEPKQRRESAKAPSNENILQPEAAIDEGKQEESIRPQRFADYIGQKDLKDVLDIAIKAAKSTR